LLQFYNRQYQLFFRGASKERYSEKRPKLTEHDLEFKEYIQDKMTTIYPSLFSLNCNKKFEMLEDIKRELRKKLIGKNHFFDKTGFREFRYFDETVLAIIQHYKIFKTNFLDITSSLSIACSFALMKQQNEGIIYVLGLPYISDIITYSPQDEIVNVKLTSIITPAAKRPLNQEGYLVGPYPYTELDNKSRKRVFDFSRRLIAKFRISNADEKFWDGGYHNIDVLEKKNDKYKKDVFFKFCDKFKNEYGSKSRNYNKCIKENISFF
jgi:hypothetical protein